MMKFIFAMLRNIEISYKLILPSSMCVSRHAQSTQNKKFVYLCNISRKTLGIKWFFCLQINAKVFYKMTFWVCATKVTQRTYIKKFLIFSQYLKENGKIEFIFCLQMNTKDFFKLILSF